MPRWVKKSDDLIILRRFCSFWKPAESWWGSSLSPTQIPTQVRSPEILLYKGGPHQKCRLCGGDRRFLILRWGPTPRSPPLQWGLGHTAISGLSISALETQKQFSTIDVLFREFCSVLRSHSFFQTQYFFDLCGGRTPDSRRGFQSTS